MFSLSASTLNHLFSQSGWALQRLAKFAGRTARFDIAPFSFAFTIQEDGSVRAADENEKSSADAICTISPALLPRLALHDENAFAQILTSGDASLLAEIFYLSRHLRWDAAEDISRVTGDIAAERIVHLAASAHSQFREGTLNLTQALAEYWTEERPLVAKSIYINSFVLQVDKLRDDVARLEQRINRLPKP
ncbi:MAG TPA: SCP2 sterol-binding domain-containing protein [Gallionellaceae bacterium]|nr:SCP2 sterol-binding domain-containing protein [Gallionellaceae bacterium]